MEIANASDFRKAQDGSFGEPEAVLLPKLGKHVMLRRPSEMWWLFNGRLPITMASKLAVTPSDNKAKVEDIVDTAEWIFHVLQTVMVEPKCALKPKNGEISPDMVDIADAMYMVRWSSGEEVGEAGSLKTFRGDRPGAHTGADGGEVALQAERLVSGA